MSNADRDNTGPGLPESLRRFMEFEQRHLWRPERFRARADEPGLDSRYLPERCETFRVPCFEVRRKDVYVYGANGGLVEDIGIGIGQGPEGSVPLPIHPAELAHCAELLRRVGAGNSRTGGVLWGTPTSSTRTVLAWWDGRPQDAFFLKMSLRSRLLGDRRIARRKVAASVGLSNVVRESRVRLPTELRYFHEPLGLTPRVMQDSGVLFRSIPREIRDGRVVVAPLFALIGGGPEHPPLLLEWMKRDCDGALKIVEEQLLARFARLWVELVFDFGMILEAHGQDLLLALSPDLVSLGGFYYRDFEGLAMDWTLRRIRGFADGVLPQMCEWFPTYETWGYRLYQLVSHKLRISLFDYLHLVLGELELAIREWQESGMVGEKVREGQLTRQFSGYLRDAIEEKYGLTEGESYDVRHHICRFVKFLMLVRRNIMADSTGKGCRLGTDGGLSFF